MQTEEENLLVRREIGDAVLAALHMQYQNRYRHAVDLLIKKS
ncbi:hypothetical protein F4826_003054 [Rahnella inusitata]|nr:hypothetical protein [Rahnella inusitata]